MCNLTRSNTVCESLTGNGCSLKVYLYNFCCWQFLTNRLFYFPNIIKIVIWSFEMVQDWTWWNRILWKLPKNYLLKSAFLLIKLLSQFSFLNLWNCWISVAIFFFYDYTKTDQAHYDDTIIINANASFFFSFFFYTTDSPVWYRKVFRSCRNVWKSLDLGIFKWIMSRDSYTHSNKLPFKPH